MKNHLKRIASPRTWRINRKQNKFILRPNAGGHPFDLGLPLGVILRDLLKYSSTMREVKKILNNKEILVDGKRRKDHRFLTGLFDVISIPQLKKYCRIILDQKGRITFIEISAEEAQIKVCKIVGKTTLKKGKVQYNLHDGKNVLSEKAAKVGDTLVLSLPKLEVQEILPLQLGAVVSLTKGKHAGDFGILKEIKEKEAIYQSGEKNIGTAKSYLFVLGNKEARIKLR